MENEEKVAARMTQNFGTKQAYAVRQRYSRRKGELLLTHCSVKKEDTLTNIHNNFDKFAKKCNVYDEAHYCHQIVVDQRLNLAAISYKCECPDGWRCPSGIADTRFVTECQFDESKHWHRCQLRCTPVNAE
ncbi:hypothetical protein NECAME_08990 [Necator americanus]|uniref:Uncharacterized protein n=1 Tax=Necator americanus TaxID=51031 RepID=W2TFU7_NECAM|nr:hypothetical protein NECAME_08990 [Necator americanus]ETN80708.1 hypothetical protein NECAME_08990 [Necator americanus]